MTAPSNVAPVRFAPFRSAPCSRAPVKLAPVNLALTSLARFIEQFVKSTEKTWSPPALVVDGRATTLKPWFPSTLARTA